MSRTDIKIAIVLLVVVAFSAWLFSDLPDVIARYTAEHGDRP